MSEAPALRVPPALYLYSLLYGGLVVLAGVLGTKLASLGTWPVLGGLAVESGIFAFLLLVVLSSTVAELYGRAAADRLVRTGFVPLIASMLLLVIVINFVPPAVFWHDQDAFARLLGQGARMQFAGLVSYGVSQTLNVAVFARLSGSEAGRPLMLRAWIAGTLSQVVDTVLFITISFIGVHDPVTGAAMPLGTIMTGQIISKLVLSTLMVPLLIQLFVSLGRRLDR